MNPRPGVLLKVFAASGATNMAACINGLDRQIPTGEVVFFRSVAALAPLEIWLGLQGGLIELTSAKHFGGHIVRSISGTGGMFFSYVALAYLPLADATSISYAAPLFTVIPAAIVLGEVVRSYHWTAVVVSCSRAGHALTASCFVCIRWGEFRRHHGILGAAFGLAAAFCSALSSVQIRHLAKTEKPGAIVLYFSLMMTVVGLVKAVFAWKMPDLTQLLLLLGPGVAGGTAQILMTLSLRHAQELLLAPFEYTTLVWLVLVGYFFLRQLPVVATIAGAFVVAAAGMFAVWREKRLKPNLMIAQTSLARQRAEALFARLRGS